MRTAKLKDITLTITDGKHGDCKNHDGSGYYFISCKDVYDETIHYENARQIAEDDFRDADRRTNLAAYDILITNSGTIGRMALVKDIPETRKTTFQKSVAIVRADTSQVVPNYLYYLLKSKVHDFINSSNGSAQKNLLLSTMRDFDISFVDSFETQHRIATILSRYDSLIENYQKQIKLLEEAAQRLYKEWFVDLRFPGYENTPVVNGVPEGWYISSITDTTLFSFVKSRVSKFDGEKIYYATADVDNTYICGNGITVNYDNKPSRAQIIPPPYSIWFARMSKSYKILGFSEKNEDRRKKTIISSGFAGFQSKVDTYGFMYCMISSQWFNNEKDRFATGSTQVSLTNEGLSRIACLFPKEDIAIKFSRVTNNIIERMVLLKETCFILTEARDRLLPKLMSGEIEV